MGAGVTPEVARAAVKRAGGNKSQAARDLKITRNALQWALSGGTRKAADPIKQAKAEAATRADSAERKHLVKRVQVLEQALDGARSKRHPPPPIKVRKGKARTTIVRVVIPDSHGAHIDWQAAGAALEAVRKLDPDQVVMLGDHLDCGGVFNAHQRSYTNELTESYAEDALQGNRFIDALQGVAGRAEFHYLEGNHEAHVERWCARNFASYRDAQLVLERIAPWAMLELKQRGVRYYRRAERYMGLSIEGTIKLGCCFYTHGYLHSKHATYGHLESIGASVVHGHTHRAQSIIHRTATADGIGAWCPGTLAKLQPLYRHTNPSSWSHGILAQFECGKEFMTLPIPIFGDRTMLDHMIKVMRP